MAATVLVPVAFAAKAATDPEPGTVGEHRHAARTKPVNFADNQMVDLEYESQLPLPGDGGKHVSDSPNFQTQTRLLNQ